MRASNWFIGLTLVLSLVWASGIAIQSRCDSGWKLNPKNDKCYFFSTKYLVEFDAAKASCESLGSHLAMPKTVEEREYIARQLNDIKKLDNEIDAGRDRYTAWLGGKQSHPGSHTIIWFDGSRTNTTFRLRPKPCDDKSRCCSPSLDLQGYLTESWCDRTFTSVCQKDLFAPRSSASFASSNIALTLLTLFYTFPVTRRMS